MSTNAETVTTTPTLGLYWVNQGIAGALINGHCPFCGEPTNPTAELWAYVDADDVDPYEAIERGQPADNPCLGCVDARDPELAGLLWRMTTPAFDEFGDWHDAFDFATTRDEVREYFVNRDAWDAERARRPDWRAWRTFDELQGEERLWREPAGQYLLVLPNSDGPDELTHWDAARWLLRSGLETVTSAPDDLWGVIGVVQACEQMEAEAFEERLRTFVANLGGPHPTS